MQVTPQLKIHHSSQRVKMQSRLEGVKVAQNLVTNTRDKEINGFVLLYKGQWKQSFIEGCQKKKWIFYLQQSVQPCIS